MAGEYPVVRLGDVCYVTDGAHAKVDRQPYGVLYLTSKNIGVGRLLLGEVNYISEKDYERLFANSPKSQRRLSPGDVLVGIIGTFGSAYLYKKHDHFGVSSAVALLRPDQSRLYPRFLYYVATSPIFRVAHSAYKSGSAQGYTNIPTIKYLPVPIPPHSEQRAIAHILGTLDDKIELNRRMNETLEALVRALFKSWFVDFDPVRAKAEGRDPGLPKSLADLFPDSFEDSELGEIPKGWKPSSVGKHFNLTMGQSPPGSTYNESGDGLPFFQGRTDFGFRFPSHRIFCTAPTRLAEVGDTLVSVRAPVGDVNIAIEPCAVGRGVAAVRHFSGSRSFTYHAMHNLGEHFDKFEGEGTVFGAINKADFERLPFVAPPKAVLVCFERLASPIDNRVESNEDESRTLVILRDTLLPKLISGELRLARSGHHMAETTP